MTVRGIKIKIGVDNAKIDNFCIILDDFTQGNIKKAKGASYNERVFKRRKV